MLCQTVKAELDCTFMSKKGCGYFGGSCRAIIAQCEDCSKVINYESGKYCVTYPDPANKWISGKCPTATHIKLEVKEATQKINPLKASKRSNKKS